MRLSCDFGLEHFALGNEVKATLVADIDLPEGQEPGAYEVRSFEGQLAGMAFRCPCGCGNQAWLPFLRKDGSECFGPEWDFNGDVDKPVLRPSIKFNGGCQWHGWLGGSDAKKPGIWVTV